MILKYVARRIANQHVASIAGPWIRRWASRARLTTPRHRQLTYRTMVCTENPSRDSLATIATMRFLLPSQMQVVHVL